METDSDSDGIPDSLEGPVDTDSDGTVDFLETDSDSDGIADSLESTIDFDSDGTPDFRDTDSDSDGIPDSLETTNDLDSDGEFDFRDIDPEDIDAPRADIAAIVSFGTPENPEDTGLIFFFGENPPELNGFTELDIRPQVRFTHFDDFGNFDPEQQEVALSLIHI